MKKLLIALALMVSSTLHAHAAAVSAKSWIIADAAGKILAQHDADTVRPIASISKLLTVMVVLDAQQELGEPLVLSDGIKDALPDDETYTRRNLIDLALVRSDNRAAYTLCQQYPGGYSACVDAMNRKAMALGMDHTQMRDATGLDPNNVSTARDLVKLVMSAKQYPVIRAAASKPTVSVWTHMNLLEFANTNPLVGKIKNFLVSKTGYTHASGGCIVIGTTARTVVLLDSATVRSRIPEAQMLLDRRF
jgi:serine-type D-Ala-D-Ala endopeptidase (penicillin-binding protein 7)